MIQLKALTICSINGGIKRKTIRLKKLKIFFESEKEIDEFREERSIAFSDSEHETVVIHLQTKHK